MSAFYGAKGAGGPAILYSACEYSGFNEEHKVGAKLEKINEFVQTKLDQAGKWGVLGNITGVVRLIKGTLRATAVAAVAAIYFGIKDKDLTIARDAFASGLANMIQGLIEIIPLGVLITTKTRKHQSTPELYSGLFNSHICIRSASALDRLDPKNDATSPPSLGQRIRAFIEPTQEDVKAAS